MATAFRYRTLPGTNHPKAAYFTRGSGHNEKAQYTEREDDYVNNMDRLARKFETMRQFVPAPVVTVNPKAKIGFVASGTSDYAVRESCEQLRDEHGIEASYLRLRAYPFTAELTRFHPPPRPRVRGGSEPRRAIAGADAPGTRPRTDRQTAQRALLRRPAAGCAHRYR